MYPKYETSFASEADGLMISVLGLIPEKEPYKGVVQLVHGMCENKERYLPFMEFLAAQGYVSVIHDHRGHGSSVKEKEDLGYMYGGGAEAILKDIDTVNKGMHMAYPDIPLILFGHSMGSLAVRAYAAEHDEQIDMLIVCGSPSENPLRAVGELLAKSENKLRGGRHKSKLLTKLSLGSYEAKFKDEGIENSWLCSDVDVCRAYTESELCGFMFTDDAFLALFGLMKRAYDISGYSCTNPHLPILFISGEEDPCLENTSRFAKAVHSIQYAGYRNVKGKLYPGMRHEILNEKEHEKVFHDILVFIEKNRISIHKI